MIGVFKRRDGWTLEKEISNLTPRYAMASIEALTFAEAFEDDGCPLRYPKITTIEFELVDFWRDSKGRYVKLFYEEL